MRDPSTLPAYEVREALLSGSLTPDDYVGSIMDRINKYEGYVNAYITIKDEEKLVEEVKRSLNKALSARRQHPLAGVLVAVKDNIHVKGMKTTCASKILAHYIAPYNATVVERLVNAGGIILGKTNMDEFAMGSTGETSAYGPTRNPWDPERVPGGSSSGSAAALAAGMATLALGSDTGGSIRLPSSWTGIYGLKPGYGRVSRYGLVAYADSLEQIGPMARNMRDLALLYMVISGFDPQDSTSLPDWHINHLEAVNKGYEIGASGLKIGVLEDLVDHPGVDTHIKSIVNKAATLLEREGAIIDHVRLGSEIIDYSLPAYYVIAMAEASSNLARYDGVRYGVKEPPKPWEDWNTYYSRIRSTHFGREVKLRVMLGSWMLSSGYRDQYYMKALKARRIIRNRLNKLLEDNDILLAPSAVTLPPLLGEVIDNPETLYALDLATVLANLAGIPALTTPIHLVNTIPLGIQLMAQHSVKGEEALFQAGAALEEATKLKNLTANPAPPKEAFSK